MRGRPVAMTLAVVVVLAAAVAFAVSREVGPLASSTTAPTVKTGRASAVTDISAVLNGTVNPRGTATTTYFEWGPTSAYGARTPDAPSNGRTSVPVKAALTGLAAGTTYHFRLVATNTGGTARGSDSIFTTGGAGPTTASTPPTSSSAPPTSSSAPPTSPSAPPSSSSSTSTAASGVCTTPYFTTSDTNGGISDGGYYVHNNLWNAARYPGTRGTTEVCSYRSWNHIGTSDNSSGDGAVKTYPNVHKDYSRRTIASFPHLTSTFAATSPGVGIYNVAYDLWLNGVPNDEVMIWTDNHLQVPAGARVASAVSVAGYTWDVYATNGNGYIAFVPSNGARLTWGTIDLKAMLSYLVSQGRVASSSTVDQVCFGVEVVDTGGVPATWSFTDFSITDS